MDLGTQIQHELKELAKIRVTNDIQKLIDLRDDLETKKTVVQRFVEKLKTKIKDINAKIDELKRRTTQGADLTTFTPK